MQSKPDQITAPPFEGGTIREEGRPVGFWILDRLDLAFFGDTARLAASHPPGSRAGRRSVRMLLNHAFAAAGPTGYSVLRVARWDGADLSCHARVFAGRGPRADEVTEATPPHRVPVRFEDVVRDLRRAQSVADDVDAATGRLRGHGANGCAASAALQAARQAIAPFTDLLDPRSVSAIPHRPGPYDGTYPGFDAGLVPGAPLRAASTRRPDLGWLLGPAWRRDREACLVDLARGGPEAAAAREAATAYGVTGARLAALSLASLAMEGRAAREGACWPQGASREDAAMPGIAKAMSSLPSNWLPRDLDGCEEFLDCASVLATLAGWCEDADGLRPLVDSGGRWGPWLARVAPPVGFRRGQLPSVQLHDVVRTLARQVLQPAAVLSGCPDVAPGHLAEHVAASLLLSGRNVRRIMEVCSRWHAGQAVVGARLRSLPGRRAEPVSWPAAIPPFSSGGLAIVPLADAMALAEEASEGPDRDCVPGLGHCVWTYDASCLEGRSRIASVRRLLPDGRQERLSTVEFVRDSGTLGVRQHRGRRNAPPPDEAETFLGRYLAAFADGTLRVSTRDMRPVRGHTRRRWAGYDIRYPGNWEVAMEAWRPLLPSGLRSARPSDWLGLMVAVSRRPGRDPHDALVGHWRATPWEVTDAVALGGPRRLGGMAPAASEWAGAMGRGEPASEGHLLQRLATWVVGSSVGHDPHE